MLKKVKGDTGAYIRHFLLKNKNVFDIKCVENHILPFILRKMKGEEPQDEDFVVVYEGLTARLLKAPNIEIG